MLATTTTEFRSATTIDDELARLDQALLDLEECRGVSVNLIHVPNATQEKSLVRQLAQRARDRRFVTAEVSLRETSPDTPDSLVRGVLEALISPNDNRPRGFLHLIDLFSQRYGKNAAERFREQAAAEGADGDLTALALAFLGAGEDVEREMKAYRAWLEGSEPARRYRNPDVRRALSERTAQRALGELTRIMRALGYRGTALFLSQGEGLTLRTSRQREKAYTVLRELVDNFDSGRGASAARITLSGTDALFVGERAIGSLTPLRMRLEIPSNAEPPPPHRSWTTLVREPYEYIHRRVAPPVEGKGNALRTLIRISEGLPPTHAVTSLSVGFDKIEETIDRLFETNEKADDAFSVLVGDYGSGKTHLMLHLQERALEANRPVFWLNLERMNLDLGNPARHLARLLEHSALPTRRHPSAAERAVQWTRSKQKLSQLRKAMEEIAAGEREEANAAKKVLQIWDHAKNPERAVENYLLALDLEQKGAGAGNRRDAYRRFLLMIALLEKMEGTKGAVLLIDEAENLYTSNASWAQRRAALRALAFYTSGAFPASVVVMAMTPTALESMRKEARMLLNEIDEMTSTLEMEEVNRFRANLFKYLPDAVPILTAQQRIELCERVRHLHRSVRGPTEIHGWEDRAQKLARTHRSPRTLIRTTIDELESNWWAGPQAST
jgi:hypothetical protein